ncbi:YeiH family protein [Pseudomonas aeruginosa]|uniref:YeiH family protein n=1 Tax=Pseudomonas aeruginosa TaxID=287 RepID=UPI00155F0227|nr:YeiH family protein [Pseudomonas aeruginosa]NRC26752.1 YeiH family protein [Pseudomonas aeruginosa]HBN8537442.1 YeiH family protein [Pseudomonas aeruginosa]
MHTLPVKTGTRPLAQVQKLIPGLLLSAALAGAAILLGRSQWLQHNGISALTLAIVLGIVVGNTLYPRIAAGSAAGVGFSKQILLRAGIILYGLRLTFQDIAGVGLHGVLLDVLMLASTFGLACLLGTRLFGLDRTTTLLIGAGSSICGAAAVMATEPVVRGRAEQVAVAVSTVVVFGTLGIFLYPALFQLDQDWGLLPRDPGTWGVYIGATVHEVAQVVAAGRSIGIEAADTAVIAKMVRVMMLAPFLILLSAWLARDKAHRRQHSGATKITIPWFAVGFVLVAGLNSLVSLPPALVSHVNDLDTFLLAMAMAGLGLGTHLSAIRRAGLKPLLLAALLFAWLVLGGGLLTRLALA